MPGGSGRDCCPCHRELSRPSHTHEGINFLAGGELCLKFIEQYVGYRSKQAEYGGQWASRNSDRLPPDSPRFDWLSLPWRPQLLLSFHVELLCFSHRPSRIGQGCRFAPLNIRGGPELGYP